MGDTSEEDRLVNLHARETDEKVRSVARLSHVSDSRRVDARGGKQLSHRDTSPFELNKFERIEGKPSQ